MAYTVKERITQLTSEDSSQLTEKFKGKIIKSVEIDEHSQLVITFDSGESIMIWGDYDGYTNLEEVVSG